MCRACTSDLTALADERTRLATIEAECCVRRMEIDADIDAILDGTHGSESAELGG